MTTTFHAADDTEKKALLRAELDHRMAVTPAMLHSIDENGLLISVSDAWLAKLGYTREEVLGRAVHRLSHACISRIYGQRGAARVLSHRPLRERSISNGLQGRPRYRRFDLLCLREKSDRRGPCVARSDHRRHAAQENRAPAGGKRGALSLHRRTLGRHDPADRPRRAAALRLFCVSSVARLRTRGNARNQRTGSHSSR